MHRLAAAPGGWNSGDEGVIFIDQTPAPIVFLTAADTEIQTLARAIALLRQNYQWSNNVANECPNEASKKLSDGFSKEFPSIRVANLLHLHQQLTIDTYAETVLAHAEVIVLRLLGGRAYWSYGLEVVQELGDRTGTALVILPGDDRPDPELMTLSTLPLTVVDQLWRYFTEGGVTNVANGLRYLAAHCLKVPDSPPPPQPIPRIGLYPWSAPTPHPPPQSKPKPRVGLLFYRAHYLAGNTAVIDALCEQLGDRQLEPVPIFISSLREVEIQRELLTYFQEGEGIDLLLNTTGFSLAQLNTEQPQVALWKQLDIPIFQVILSGETVQQWQSQLRGLSPRDMAMNVALPEVDGRIISRAISFKAVQANYPDLETDGVGYVPQGDRLKWVGELAARWIELRRTPPSERRIAVILANYPNRDGRLANGVGLDTPASCIAILQALKQAGYLLENIPQNSDDLIQILTTGFTNDPEGRSLRRINQFLTQHDYQTYFQTLPHSVQEGITKRWGVPDTDFPISGFSLGHVFVGIQPSRGYDRDPALNYHAPDLEPTHDYLAFYHWLRQNFAAQAIIHVGKHGNLEWLPGKSIALSQQCYPEVALGPLPHFYPFIVNDPGEGSQAKRRAQAVIIDHLTPPLTRAELYGPLLQLEQLVDEYYDAQALDPSRLPVIRDRLQTLIQKENLTQDIDESTNNSNSFQNTPSNNSASSSVDSFETILTRTDGYLCELKEAQIRDGLHIFGHCPQGSQLRDLLIAIARHPHPPHPGLTRAIAQDWHLDFDPLTCDPAQPIPPSFSNPLVLDNPLAPSPHPCRTLGDIIELLEHQAAQWVDTLLTTGQPPSLPGPATRQTFTWMGDRLLPALSQTDQELTQLLRGLNGQYVPSGPSGAPTRGRPEVLPTGRNFYSVDIRAIPTESAWAVGRKAAETLIERYTQENGAYPQTLALSVWGTSTMRTGGDDIAEAFALLGVQPIWDGPSRRVIDFEILPLSVLGRPRVDVTLRISGFFRDAFPHVISLFSQAVRAIAHLCEPPDQNPLAAAVHQETTQWQTAGLTPEEAENRAHYRIFGSKPGAYGAGLQGLIDAQNWTSDDDLARAYINWSCYAYTDTTGPSAGKSAPEAFTQRLKHLQIVLHNQDNREHDLLDSDDYYQFQGGLTVAARSLQGKNPHTYFGDHSLPENPKIRTLQAEILRVYRSRVINPKWLAGVMRHGYKGAFEMAATVDYLFAYDATAQCVPDFLYHGIAQSYLFDPTVQQFVQNHNPWALRDMAERLLEAHQRGLWQNPSSETLEQLRAIALQAEAHIETHLST